MTCRSNATLCVASRGKNGSREAKRDTAEYMKREKMQAINTVERTMNTYKTVQ